MRLVFMGTPEFAVPALKMLAANGYDIKAVFTQLDTTAGRGQSLAISPVKKTALELSLPVFQPANFKSPAVIEQLRSLQPDAVIVAAYGVILPPSVLAIPPLGCLNLHPSLLPLYRGVAPVSAAILNGDAFTGVSVMLLDRGVDTGPILAQAAVPVLETDTTGSLTEKLASVGAQLLLDVIPRLQKKEVTPRAQDNNLSSYTRMMTKADGEINWQKPAVEIWRQVRAYQPWPGSYTRWQGKQLKIIAAAVAAGQGAPGKVTVLPLTGALAVATPEGMLLVEHLQLEGKKVMSAADFIRGQRQFADAVLPS